jgi:hypothetical protein
MKSWFINISEQYKYFTWTPERTGSTHFTNIISKLEFQSADIVDGKIISYKENTRHNHFCTLFENHWDYKFIITTRNPYSMVLSMLGVSYMENLSDVQYEIELRIEHILQNPFDSPFCCQCFQNRKPDYFLRLENLYEDWIKIPFVQTHELNISGELKKLTEIRMNEQKNTEDVNYWKKYYNKRIADLVYYNFPNNFELFGYDKDSWK